MCIYIKQCVVGWGLLQKGEELSGVATVRLAHDNELLNTP